MRFGIVLFDGVEPIDLGAYGVLSIATRFEPSISMCTISTTGKKEMLLAGGLRVVADYLTSDAPECDVIMVTGGPTWPQEITRAETLNFLRARKGKAILAAACMGVMPLVAAGVLDGCEATIRNQTVGNEKNPIERINSEWPAVRAKVARIVDQGDVVTGGGGILNVDVALYLLERLHSKQLADDTARILEYRESAQGNKTRLGDFAKHHIEGL